jgi:hypothetical protein
MTVTAPGWPMAGLQPPDRGFSSKNDEMRWFLDPNARVPLQNRVSEPPAGFDAMVCNGLQWFRR